VSAFFCVVLSCVGSGLAMGQSSIHVVLPNDQNRFVSFRSQIPNRNRPEGLIRIHYILIKVNYNNKSFENEGGGGLLAHVRNTDVTCTRLNIKHRHMHLIAYFCDIFP
jgi:hypothetical protein